MIPERELTQHEWFGAELCKFCFQKFPRVSLGLLYKHHFSHGAFAFHMNLGVKSTISHLNSFQIKKSTKQPQFGATFAGVPVIFPGAGPGFEALVGRGVPNSEGAGCWRIVRGETG